jgi:hypothetical protein
MCLPTQLFLVSRVAQHYVFCVVLFDIGTAYTFANTCVYPLSFFWCPLCFLCCVICFVCHRSVSCARSVAYLSWFDLFAVHTKKQRYFTTVKVNVKENRRDTPECTIKRDRQHCAHKTQNDDKQSKLHAERKYSTELLNALSVTWYQLVYDLYPCFIVSSRFKLSLVQDLTRV